MSMVSIDLTGVRTYAALDHLRRMALLSSLHSHFGFPFWTYIFWSVMFRRMIRSIPCFLLLFFFCEENDPVYNSWKMILITQHICPLVYFNFDFGEYLDQRCSEKWLGWICFLNKMILCIIYIAENGTDSANKWIFISWMLVKSEICKGIDSLHILSVASHCILYCLGSSLSSVRITNLTLNAEQHHAWSSDNDPYRPS